MPQRPYIFPQSLRANLRYPNRADSEIADADLIEALRTVGLEHILEHADQQLDVERDWGNILSIGEQQRLSFARILLYKPELAFLDESTSALDEENEKNLYTLLRQMKCSFVSVGHRSTLREFHDCVLTVTGTGEWTLGA